jgi:hypothetical protein
VTALLVLAVSSLDAAVEENRSTWLLLAIAALAGRLATEDALGLHASFSALPQLRSRVTIPPLAVQPDS